MGYEKHIETRLESRFEPSEKGQKLKMGDIFKQMVMFLKTYTQYVTNYSKVQALLVAQKNNEELLVFFSFFLFFNSLLFQTPYFSSPLPSPSLLFSPPFPQNLFSSLAPENERRGVKDFLIMPVQRIPRLKLMLEELLKNTWPAHPDFVDLGLAAKKIAEVASYVEVAQQKVCWLFLLSLLFLLFLFFLLFFVALDSHYPSPLSGLFKGKSYRNFYLFAIFRGEKTHPSGLPLSFIYHRRDSPKVKKKEE